MRRPARRSRRSRIDGSPGGGGPHAAADGGTGGAMSGADFLNLVISALLLAGVYAAMAVGMTIIYGVMKIVNLACAGFLMTGAYFVYELYERGGAAPLLGVVLAFRVFFLCAVGLPRGLTRRLPVSDQPTLACL